MSHTSFLPTLNFAQTVQGITACLRANRACGLVSGPGIGKSAAWTMAANAIGMRGIILVASNYDMTDFAGLPYVHEGKVLRALFPEIAAACVEPVVLVFDDATMVSKSVEGPMLRITLERNAGGNPLHKDTRVGLAFNPPSQAPGGLDFSAALVNRILQLKMCTTVGEVAGYFRGEPVKMPAIVLDPEAFAAQRRIEWAEFSATLEVAPQLLEFDPGQASIDGGEPFASPRGWEIGLDCFAGHSGQDDDVGRALLAGIVGRNKADAYLAIRKLRVYLPTHAEVLATPDKAKVPSDEDHQIAALGLIARVAETDTWAAWIYAQRLAAEFGAASARYLMNRPPKSSKHAIKGKDAMMELLAKIRHGGSKR